MRTERERRPEAWRREQALRCGQRGGVNLVSRGDENNEGGDGDDCGRLGRGHGAVGRDSNERDPHYASHNVGSEERSKSRIWIARSGLVLRVSCEVRASVTKEPGSEESSGTDELRFDRVGSSYGLTAAGSAVPLGRPAGW